MINILLSILRVPIRVQRAYLAHMNSKKRGRPATKPARLKDGFYVEIRNKGANAKIMMRSDDRKGMMDIVKKYEAIKDVTILGEHKNDRWISESVAAKK